MRRETILVIESHDDVRDAFEAVLDYYGFHVVGARDWKEGAELARADPPSLVLGDVSALAADGHGPVHPFGGGDGAVPVVGLAPEPPPREERERLEARLAGLIVKPVRPDQLLAEIRRVLGPGSA